MHKRQSVNKIILLCIMMSVPFVLAGQTHDCAYKSAYVSALERDLEHNDNLYRARRTAEFDHSSVLSLASYVEMPVDSVASYICLLEDHDTLSQDNLNRIAALKAYKERLCAYKDAYAVTCVRYDSSAVAAAVAVLNDIKGKSTAEAQIEDIETLLGALAVFGEQSAVVLERFNITDVRVERRINLYRSRTMDSVLARSLSEDFLEPWFATEQVKALNAESPVGYIRTITGRMFGLISQMKSLDSASPAGKANELLEELLGLANEL